MTNSIEVDMKTRLLPTDQAVDHANALLLAEPAADVAVIPMYLPGKQRGIWTIGQEVHTVPGVLFLATTGYHPAPGVPSLSWARSTACDIAREVLRADPRGGTVAYVIVESDVDGVAVYEDSEGVPAHTPKPRRSLQVGEKECVRCGRIGTRDFVKTEPGGPESMGPFKCRWEGACDKRYWADRKG
jgi:hypothetical protein